MIYPVTQTTILRRDKSSILDEEILPTSILLGIIIEHTRTN